MMTQVEWLVVAMMSHPDSTTGDIYSNLEGIGHRVRNVTGRMSDARAQGVDIAKRVDDKGLSRFVVTRVPDKIMTAIRKNQEEQYSERLAQSVRR